MAAVVSELSGLGPIFELDDAANCKGVKTVGFMKINGRARKLGQ
jgi:hypothetical protein